MLCGKRIRLRETTSRVGCAFDIDSAINALFRVVINDGQVRVTPVRWPLAEVRQEMACQFSCSAYLERESLSTTDKLVLTWLLTNS